MGAEADDETHGMQTLQDVVSAVEAQDYEEVIRLCEKEATEDTYPAEILSALHKLYAPALIRNQQYKQALAVITANENGDRWSSELQAYAHYKQKDYQQVVALAKQQPDSSTALQYMLAQSLYHQADTKGACQLFQQLLENADLSEEDKVQIYTNLVTVLFADATPYCASSSSHRNVVDAALAFLENHQNDGDDYPYDLAYGLASWQLFTTAKASERALWRQLLHKAIAACQNLNSDDELAVEVGPLQINQTLFSSVFWNQTAATDTRTEVANNEEDTKLPAALQSVRRANQALSAASPSESLKVLSAEPDAKLTPLQKRLWYYNRAVMQLRAGKQDDCRATCQFLQKHLLQLAKHSKKKKASTATEDSSITLVVHDPEDQMWWEARILVLLAHCGGDGDKAVTSLDPCLEKCRALPPTSRVRDHTLTYLMVHKAALETASNSSNGSSNSKDSILTLLQDLSATLSSPKPAVVATLATLYHEAGNESKAAELLKSVNDGGGGDDDNQAMADFAMAQGNYEQAAALYETEASKDGDAAAKARWIRALSYTDPAKATKLWAEMTPYLLDDDEEEEELNGAELEAKELPRNLLKSQQQPRRTDPALMATNDEKTKNREAVLRRRARQREAYLAEQQAKGTLKQPPGQPDPERWIPKYERSSARRRRYKGGGPQHKGAQGGVSEKDAAKLDVVARQAARASGAVDTSRSTAHMNVSGARKSGKRR